MILSVDTPTPALEPRQTRLSTQSHGAEFRQSLTDTPAPAPPPAQPPAASATGFVRSNASSAPGQVPRFESVPDAAKWPLGPYKQAPTEFGGEWWLVNPFSGPQPWVRAAEIAAGMGQAETVPPPDDFVKLFGPGPERAEASSRGEYILRTAVWDRELADFQGVGIPDGYTEEQVRGAADAMKQWGLGDPVFYKSRDAWKARFPDSLLPKFEISPETAIKAPQVTAAVYHVQAILRGLEIENRHPLVPSEVFPLERYTVNA